MSTRSQQRPVIAVIGTTGVGKSQLAVSLGKSVQALGNFEAAVVLSADSMQLYEGLNVITNKVTEEEKEGIEHWGLDVVKPGEGGSWELGKWCTEAGKKIDSLPTSTLPIICGGTHYFIQHFLFPPKELSTERPREQEKTRNSGPLATRWLPPTPCPSTPESMKPELRTLLNTFWMPEALYPSEGDIIDTTQLKGSVPSSRPTISTTHELLSLWRVLESIDPDEAKRWHWRDGRKVRRAIERWWERGGRKVQAVVEAPERSAGGREARFRTILFWVFEHVDLLRPRLDRRIDKMVDNGLLQEIQELREVAVRMYGSVNATDHAEGIFQAIGYKEFAELELPQKNPTADPNFQEMLKRMKLSTHQYAKAQVKWIRKQLLPAIREARAMGGDVHLYVVPGGTDGEGIARSITQDFLHNHTLPDPRTVGHPDAVYLTQPLFESSSRVPNTVDRQLLNSRRNCEICSEPDSPYSVKAADWEEHLKSKIHRRKSKLGNLTKEEWIEEQRRKGQAKRTARDTAQMEGTGFTIED